MTLNQLLYFYRAAQLEHFNLAAESLHISEPSLSRSIRSLEQEFDVSLFEKRGRNVTLTKAGEIFYEHVEVILKDIKQAERKMHEIATDGGHINVGYVAPLARTFLPHSVHAFSQSGQNNHLIFNFFEGYTSQLIEGLKNRSYDIIFGSYDAKESDIEFIPIAKQKMVVILSKNHPLADQETIDHTAFSIYPVLTYDQTSGLGKETKDFFQSYGVQPKISYSFPDEASIASFVAEDFGIALVADVHEIHRDDVLIKDLIPQEQLYHSVYMGYLRGVYQLPAVTRFIQFIQQKDHDQEMF